MTDAEAVGRWLGALATRLPRHARVLRELRAYAAGDSRVRVVLVGCSIGRGAGDELSDVDVNVSAQTEDWEALAIEAAAIVRGLDDGEPLLVLDHRMAELGDLPHRRVFAELSDGVQVDLTVTPLSTWSRRGRAPDIVALYDPDGWTEPLIEGPRGWRAADGDVREWWALAWIAVSDCAKYLARGSEWEAVQRLDEARSLAWQLWAAAIDAPLPRYGVTAVFDVATPSAPPGMDATLPAEPSSGEVRRAACALAAVLDDVATRLEPDGRLLAQWDGFRTAVRARLPVRGATR